MSMNQRHQLPPYQTPNRKKDHLNNSNVGYIDEVTQSLYPEFRKPYHPSLIDDSRVSRRMPPPSHTPNITTTIPNNNYYQDEEDDDERTATPISMSQKKPYVGITAATRFRRAHTLDMIRSTKMPVNNAPSNNYCTNPMTTTTTCGTPTSVKMNDYVSSNLNNNNNNTKIGNNNSSLLYQQASNQYINPKLIARF